MTRAARLRRLIGGVCLGAVGWSAVAGCAAGSPAIGPGSPRVDLGATEQFSVTGDVPVIWGLAESGMGSERRPPAYPLAVSANGRYLVDRQGQPWRVQADAAWLMSASSTPEQVEEYLATRSGQGFNSFYLMAMVHQGGYAAAPNAPDNLQGDPPFATPGRFSTAGASPTSERYWEGIDAIIDRAAAHDMVVMLAYTYLGFGGGDQGWYEEVLAQPSRQDLFDWGRWLGERYKSRLNLIWFGLGDFTPPAGSEGAKRVRAIADGIRAAGATQLFMAEPSGPDGIPSDVPEFAAVLDQNSFYGYGPGGQGPVYQTADRAWRLSPTRPAWMQEGTYEYEDNTGAFTRQPWETRRGRFWSVLAGGTAGDGFGSRDVWQWQRLPASLETRGAAYSQHTFDLFASLPWWQLVPSGTDEGFAGTDLVGSGRGTWGEPDYITSAITTDHRWLLAYVPVTHVGARAFDVDMAALAGPVRARWFDPATGNYLAISDGYEYDNTGHRTFMTPDRRRDGTDDWLLVLDATGSARCGTITSAGLYTAPSSIPVGVRCEITAALPGDPSEIERVPLDLG
jgi:Protein of unknown function (DUF4038)/Putative collagen-binding domain of a collagenase